MSKSISIYQVDSFTKEVFSGNPAGVVLGAEVLTDAQMQQIARELNNSETAFVLPPDSDDCDVIVRYFTPTTEIPSCGHATIAAHYVRAIVEQLPEGRFLSKIGIGVLPVDIELKDETLTVVMTQGKLEFGEPLSGELLENIKVALGIETSELAPNLPVQYVTTGHGKILIPLKEKYTLDNLRPNLSALIEVGDKLSTPGFFPFSLSDFKSTGLHAHGRMFAPKIGINEDPVTGNACGPLGGYLVKHKIQSLTQGSTRLFIRQGETIKRPGTVEVRVLEEEPAELQVQICGSAVIVFEAKMNVG